MRKLAAAMTTLVAMLASLTGSGPAQAAADTHSAVRLQPKVVTLAESGVTVVLPVGATILLQLGRASADWRVQVADEAILTRVPGISVLRGENVWVPVRWVTEALGYHVTWDPAARVAVLRR